MYDNLRMGVLFSGAKVGGRLIKQTRTEEERNSGCDRRLQITAWKKL